jgi:hypothetical protein
MARGFEKGGDFIFDASEIRLGSLSMVPHGLKTGQSTDR